jgi:hypothetical protein
VTVHTGHGPTFDREITTDAEHIDRKVVRIVYHHEPDWTGVQWDTSVRVTYRIDGELIQFDEPIGKVPARSLEHGAYLDDKARNAYDRIVKLCNDLGLDIRGAAFQHDRRNHNGNRTT